MNDVAQTTAAPTAAVRAPAGDRRADVEAKQANVAALLQEVGKDGLLLLDPANFGWLTAGAAPTGVPDPDAMPALYCTASNRWLLAANVDSQRFFDEELDGLGFQLKEWPWYWNRGRYLTELANGRALACDRAFADARPVGEPLARLRRALSPYEQSCLRELGRIVGHALEATSRTLALQQTEQEIAGQLCHRLCHRGVRPVAVGVTADGRSRLYRRPGFSAVPVRRACVLTATATKFGLFVSASRAVHFGAPEPAVLREYDAACKVVAAYVGGTGPRAVPRDVLNLGRLIYLISGGEHEWRTCPQGHVTGRAPVELALTPTTLEMFQPGWAVSWNAAVGEAISGDTYLVTEQGAELITATEFWPVKSFRVQGAEVVRPHLLVR